jgi:hypothetical protein
MIEAEVGAVIDEGDANCGLHGATFELEGNENKSED